MTEFTPVPALVGGILIGLSSLLLLTTLGRVAGISGILAGSLDGPGAERPWRLAFLAGLIGAATGWAQMDGHWQPIVITDNLPLRLAGGFLVGFGTRLGSGCTSGHGVCGLARLSPRSAVAVAVFLGVAMLTVFVTRHLVG